MSAPHYARLASKALSRSEPPLASPSPAERAAAVAAIGAALSSRARRRRARGWAVAAGAVAATFVLAFGGARFLSRRAASVATAALSAPSVPNVAPSIVGHPVGGGSLVVSGAEVTLDDGRPLGVGSRLVTPEGGRTELSFTTGTSVVLGSSTDMTVGADGATQLLRLEAGSLELHVAKLQAGHRFLVDTADSEVEVRGTRFRVAVVPADPACGGGVRTRVTVTEGVVSVRHAGTEDRVPAGDRWPAGCEAAPPPVVAARAAAGAPPGSTLAQQNDLFASAVAARRRGESRAALGLLDRFSVLYPSSPLAEGVMVERMRILRGGSPAKAVALARDYLARYPNGLARAEAEAIVAGDP